ncbi:MAG: NAD(P)-dependent oxidoreductase [bacterium]|nr:NAD(P)-dependent oxidoreductase [bacterium]
MSGHLDHVLVTGGTGCIGAAAVRDFLALGASQVTVATRSNGPGSLPLWLKSGNTERLQRITMDIGERATVHDAIQSLRPTAIVHLGALQSPDCQNDPDLGLRINVGGTLNVLDAAESAGSVERFVFASSAAVYGLRERYPTATVTESAELAPPNLYGAWKVAGEHLAQQFAERTGIATVALRLNTTYGPGRDRGMTAAVTHAMKSVARGMRTGTAEPYRMPYGGRENYHYVEDVAAHFSQCTVQTFDGYGVFNIRGRTMPVSEFLDTIAEVAASFGHPDAVDLGIAEDAAPSPFVCDLDETAVTATFAELPRTDLRAGIERTLRAFQEID